MDAKRVKSYMMAIPQEQRDLEDIEGIIERLSASSEFRLLSHRMEVGTVTIRVNYKGDEFRVDFYPAAFELHEFYREQHFFSDIDVQNLEAVDAGVATEMLFSENSLDSYHLQLKIMDAIH